MPAVRDPAPEELEAAPAPTVPARATLSFHYDELTLVAGELADLPAHVFGRLASLGLVERA